MAKYKLSLLLLLVVLVGCEQQAPTTPKLGSNDITKLIPARVKERGAWGEDIANIFNVLSIHSDAKNVCTAIAIIDQESNFVADPAVPNLGATALKALDEKLEEKLGKKMATLFRYMLENSPTKDDSFIKRIKAVKTEKQLDELFREMFDYFGKTYKVNLVNDTAKLLGSGIDERLNPITTLGSMQVHISYAKAHRRANMNDDELRADLYSRYGGLYYGIHRLMLYQADYDKPLYRFADYNSGMYSSRNASFQKAVSELSGKKLTLDGDLLLYKDGSVLANKGQTETALITLLPLGELSEFQIRQDLRKEKSQKFESTKTYTAIKTLYEQKTKKPMPYAIMPQVTISGPKLSKDYDTNWFATSVNKRYDICMAVAKKNHLL